MPGDAMSHAVFRTMSGTDATLERFARATGTRLHISFEPKAELHP